MISPPTYDAVLTLEEVLKWKFQSEELVILPFSRRIRIPKDRIRRQKQVSILPSSVILPSINKHKVI
jgi:hypothetical protein